MTDAATALPGPRTLVAQTVRVELGDVALEHLLPRQGALAWIRDGDGIVAWGETARIETTGPNRFADASAWWRRMTGHAVVRDSVDVPGSGLVAFGSFAFGPSSSALIVPSVVVGRRGDLAWVTTISDSALVTAPTLRVTDPPTPPRGAVFSDGSISGAGWESIVSDATAAIRAGELDKVVLARDLVADLAEPLDVRAPLHRLAGAYPNCWTFHVDGLFGATPEMLVRRERGLVMSRVLAGTIRRTGDDEHDLALAASLARSSKDLEEHEYAVRSVADALEPSCSSMNVPEAPFVLHLPNVMHLATDVAGVVDPDHEAASALDLAAALHPSAAVGGTPRAVALDLIDRLEPMDRGRYAGPVGWIDADGDGEWGIALRSAEYDGTRVRLFAGCGIVADSDPEAELAESQAKLVPIRDALSD
ncbi:menaquinone-specific isochorismate synthase [Mumia flava]|uniref:isochorismate synthase n=1 Tax=Mumia flava TaxID=1348852 RepID=A0A0B2B9H9_9ACTN|nr:isochorismate synthase [Mumia flava]PJJ58242.1 menaquinone-specific isochorismate synthase [Mumia flava]